MSVKTKFIIVILSILKLWLIAAIPITAIGTADHDDRLFLNLASSLIQGEWLGTYNHMTLTKGPMYPMWLAFNFYIGLPLLFAQHLLYLCASLMLVIALKKVVTQSFILIFIYALVIFSPHMEVITRVVREGIYPALSILVLASSIGLYTNRFNRLIIFALWSIILGIALTAFWLAREEGVWILPSVILVITYMIFSIYRTDQLSSLFLKKIAICLLPFFILFGGLQWISIINKMYYNTYTVVEFKSESFLAAYGALSRVKHPNWKRYLPVPKEVRHSIYKISPAFKELEYSLEEQLKIWQIPGCRLYKICNDISGGWFMWALRDAVALAGYYKSGSTAEHYYSRLANEINTACDNKQLDCLPQRVTMMPPLAQAHIKPVMKAFWKGMKHLVRGFNYPINNDSISHGTEELLVLFQDIARERLAPLPSQKNDQTMIIIRGWAFSLKGEEIYFHIRSLQNENSNDFFKLLRISRPDVHSHAKNKTGIEYKQAKDSGFLIQSSCSKSCDLLIFDQKAILAVIDLATKEKKFLSDDLWVHIDNVKQEKLKKQLTLQNRLNQVKITILQKIAQFYEFFIPWLSILAIAAYIISFSISILHRKLTFLFVLNTAIIGAIIVRLLILALIDATSFPAIDLLYMSPLFPLFFIFLLLSITDVMQKYQR